MTHDDGEDIHFVVGYRTFFDATESDKSTKSSKADVKATFPASDTVAPGSRGALIGDTLDEELSDGHSSKSQGKSRSRFQESAHLRFASERCNSSGSKRGKPSLRDLGRIILGW